MNKIKLLILALFCCIGSSAWGQAYTLGDKVTDLTTIDASKQYAIYIKSYQAPKGKDSSKSGTEAGYLFLTGSRYKATKTLPTSTTDCLWKLTHTGSTAVTSTEGAFACKDVKNGKSINSFKRDADATESGFGGTDYNENIRYIFTQKGETPGEFTMLSDESGNTNSSGTDPVGCYLNYWIDNNEVWIATNADRAMTVEIYEVVIDNTLFKISRNDWTVTAYAGTTDGEGPMADMLDGSATTFFHSDWQGKVSGQTGNKGNQAFMIDMGAEYELTKVTFLPRDKGSGIPTSYRIYVSNNPLVDFSTMTDDNHNTALSTTTLGDATLTGTFDNTTPEKTATFAEPVKGQYILLVSDVQNQYLMCAEFNAYHKENAQEYTVECSTENGGIVYSNNNYTNGQKFSAAPDLSAKDLQAILLDNYFPNAGITVSGSTVTVTYEASWSPSLETGTVIDANVGKAKTMTASTEAADNAHWYIMTQTRGSETALTDNNESATLYRHATTKPSDLVSQDVSANAGYLVRFIQAKNNSYYIQFASGLYINSGLKPTANAKEAGTFMFYNINSTDEHFGWNLTSDGTSYGSIVDNNGNGTSETHTLVYWSSGAVSSIKGNNDWAIYSITMVDPKVAYENELTSLIATEYATGTDPGYYDGTKVNAAKTSAQQALDDPNRTKESLSEAITAYNTAISNAINPIVAGKYYILNGKTAFNKTKAMAAKLFGAYNNDTGITSPGWCEYSQTDPNQIWTLEAVEGKDNTFKFKNAWTGEYMATVTSMGAEGNEVTASSLGSQQFKFVINSQTIHANFHGYEDAQQKGAPLTNWDGAAGSASAWYLVAATNAQELTAAQTLFAKAKSTQPFDIAEGATVVGPGEFANPVEINSAIAGLQKIDTNDITEMGAAFNGEAGRKISLYKLAVAKYGTLSNVNYTFGAQYGTLIMPCSASKVEGMKVYTCDAVNTDNTLALTEHTGDFVQKVPYIVEMTGDRDKFQFIGWKKSNDTEDTETIFNAGILYGTLHTIDPAGITELAKTGTNYILKKQDEKVGFYKLEGTYSNLTIGANRCYLTLPDQSDVKAFYFDLDDVTGIGINDIVRSGAFSQEQGNDSQGELGVRSVNLAGQAVGNDYKGIVIRNGKKILNK